MWRALGEKKGPKEGIKERGVDFIGRRENAQKKYRTKKGMVYRDGSHGGLNQPKKTVEGNKKWTSGNPYTHKEEEADRSVYQTIKLESKKPSGIRTHQGGKDEGRLAQQLPKEGAKSPGTGK